MASFIRDLLQIVRVNYQLEEYIFFKRFCKENVKLEISFMQDKYLWVSFNNIFNVFNTKLLIQ